MKTLRNHFVDLVRVYVVGHGYLVVGWKIVPELELHLVTLSYVSAGHNLLQGYLAEEDENSTFYVVKELNRTLKVLGVTDHWLMQQLIVLFLVLLPNHSHLSFVPH